MSRPHAVAPLAGLRYLLDRIRLQTDWGLLMANHSEVAYTTADGNDYEAHEKTYVGFIALVKWGTISVAAILILMAIFLT